MDAEVTPGLIDRRTFLAILGAVAAAPLAACEGEPPSGTMAIDATDWFTPDSLWNKALPDDAPEDGRSADFLAWLDEHTNGFLLAGLHGNRWGMPCFSVGENDPSWDVSVDGPISQIEPIMQSGLRAPEQARYALTGTGDSPIVILDPTRGYQAALWRTSTDGNTFRASTAAIYWNDSNGLAPGDMNPDGDPRNGGHRGIAPSIMLVQRREIEEANIRHVLKVAIPGTAEWHVRPMVAHEPNRGGVIGEGMRLRIRADADLDAYGLTAPARTIARALQRYGAIIGDNSGANAIVLKTEQDDGQWSGVPLQDRSLGAIPIDDLIFIEGGWEPEA